jgi:hypothetical protein
MRIPAIRGRIERRVLVNYRVDPEVLARLLPAPFRPQTVEGHGLAGICLIRLAEIRPKGLPARLGVSSENAAHRIAVEWDDRGTVRQGVFIRRRDTDSLLNVLAGGRVFPGTHHRARFSGRETARQVELTVVSDDAMTRIAVRGATVETLPCDSIFQSLEDASRFFQAGSLGYSPSGQRNRFQGLELNCHNWQMTPLAIEAVESSYFDDRSRFPEGSIRFDSALLMRDIEHEWHGQPDLGGYELELAPA